MVGRYPDVVHAVKANEFGNAISLFFVFLGNVWSSPNLGERLILGFAFVLVPIVSASWVAWKLSKSLMELSVAGADRYQISPMDFIAGGLVFVAAAIGIRLALVSLFVFALGASTEITPILLTFVEVVLAGCLLYPFYLVTRRSALPIAQIAVAVVFIFAVNSVALLMNL